MARPHCPHCLLPIHPDSASPFPPQAIRCEHCRLIIGAGRARQAGEEEGDARSRGSAAGVAANAARRAGAAPSPERAVAAALRDTAAELNCPVERLRMLDYQRVAEHKPGHPTLSSVLATHGTWKSARAAAAEYDFEREDVVAPVVEAA